MNSQFKKISLLAILVIAPIALLKSIPAFVDTQQLKHSIEEGLQESMGVHVRVQELALDSALQGLQVHLNTNAITDKHNNPLGDIRNITVQIRYWPLLTQQLPEISKIHLNHVTVPVGEYNLFEALDFDFKKPKQTGFIKPAELKDTEILITNYHIEDIKLADSINTLLPNARHFRATGPAIAIRHLESNQHVSVEGHGRLSFTSPQKSALPTGDYHLLLELPQAMLDEGTVLSVRDLRRLNLDLKGQGLNLKFRYKHPAKQAEGVGHITANALNLTHTQALTLQLGDTFGLSLPDALTQHYLLGKTDIKDGFRLRFLNGNKVQAILNGNIRLLDVAVARADAWPRRMVSGLNGNLRAKNDLLTFNQVRFLVSNLPVQLNGAYHLKKETLNIQASGNGLRLASLQNVLADFGISITALQKFDLNGNLDINAHLTGTASQPAYQGNLVFKDGTFLSTEQGLSIENIAARFQFKGLGLQKPKVSYQGEFHSPNGKLISNAYNLTINQLVTDIKLHGTFTAGEKNPKPHYEGTVKLADGTYKHPDTDLSVEQIRGLLKLNPEQITVENFRGTLGNALLNADGTVSPDLEQYKIRITSNDINLQRFKTDVLAKLPQAAPLANQLQPYSGTADLDMTVSSGMQVAGQVDLHALALNTGHENYPIQVSNMSFLFNNQGVNIPATTAYYGPVALQLEGNIQRSGDYRFRVRSDEIQTELLRESAPLLTAISGLEFPEIWNTAGNFGLDGLFSKRNTSVTLDFNRVGLSWQGGDFPLYDLNGRLFYQQTGNQKPIVASRNLTFRYGNSPIALDIHNQDRFSLLTSGVLSPLTVNHFLVSPQSKATPYGEIPFRANTEGVLASMPTQARNGRNDVYGTLFLDLDNAWTDRSQDSSLPQPQNQAPVNTVYSHTPAPAPVLQTTGVTSAAATILGTPPDPNNPSNPLNPNSQSNAYLNARLHWLDGALNIEEGILHLFGAGDLLANGNIQNLFTPGQRQFELHALTQPEIQLAQLSQTLGDSEFFKDAKGTINTNLSFTGGENIEYWLTGVLQANEVSIPYLTVENLTGKLTVDGQTASADIGSFKIPGLDAHGSAITEELFQVPVTLENVVIKGSMLNVQALGHFNDQIIAPILVDQIAHSFMRPWQQGDPVLPVQFRNADLQFDEAILENILINNLKSDFSVYANGFFELTNTSLEAAGGLAKGYFSMNPRENNFMTLELNAENIKANALTRALLNVTNQVFGDLNGTVRFTTFGKTDQELQRNANGTVRLRITDGRLPAIARVETLLATANVIRGGVLGLNLNNLLRSLTIYDTNYFAELSGDLLIANGVLHTENLVSDGTNLDLFIQGTLGLDDGDANMLVNGQMSQDVAGRLGVLGQLSLNRLLRLIPGIGNLGKNQPGIISYIPGIGYVPGLGGPASDASYFQVRLAGQLDDPAAIRDFQWIKPPNASP